jgi:ATP-dependent Clp protease adaptor protein ClpS
VRDGEEVTPEPDERPLDESLYRVLILNDDATPMEFVVDVMERFFGKDHEAALRTMLHIHHHGIGDCGGVYPYEAAKNKVTEVMDFSRKHQHPLQCVMEKNQPPWPTGAGRAI